MDHRVTTAISIMRRELAERVSVLRLSRTVNLSSSRFRQLFKEDTGRSPMQYLHHIDPVNQWVVYALASASRTRLPVKALMCAWFDEKDYFEFFPLQAVKTKSAHGTGLKPRSRVQRSCSSGSHGRFACFRAIGDHSPRNT